MGIDRYAEKERAILEAVTALCRDGADMHALRIADVAKAAGIGKGTVYEYFTSKEELFARALNYCMEKELQKLLAILLSPGKFRETVYRAMEHVTLMGVQGFLAMWTMAPYLGESLSSYAMDGVRASALEYRRRLFEASDAVIDRGAAEGIVAAQEDIGYQHDVLRSFYLGLAWDCEAEDSAKMDHAYSMLVKALNP